jgi:DNA-binding transcriptional MerR regulator
MTAKARGRDGGDGRAPARQDTATQDREATLTIEQLAAETGMTVRNIRAHRARGLLPAPQVRERVGYYGPEHVMRLRLITQMQADGFNLRAIQRLLEQTHGRPEALLSLREAVSCESASGTRPTRGRSPAPNRSAS